MKYDLFSLEIPIISVEQVGKAPKMLFFAVRHSTSETEILSYTNNSLLSRELCDKIREELGMKPHTSGSL